MSSSTELHTYLHRYRQQLVCLVRRYRCKPYRVFGEKIMQILNIGRYAINKNSVI